VSPLANAIITEADLRRAEPFYPLCAFVCGSCYLVQLEEFEAPEAIFSDYSYFSSYSTTWLEHVERYTAYATRRFGLDRHSFVVEIASNDGYLLQYFAARGIPVLGVEPAANVASAALERGVPTEVRFFGSAVAEELATRGRPDLVVANNVLAHVPDLNDFVEGIAILLKPGGTATLEFPHLLRLVEEEQFDTIYHEHFSYFSLLAVEHVFGRHGLVLIDVEELPTHGGSLRIFVAHDGAGSANVEALLSRERDARLDQLETYTSFDARVRSAKRAILSFFINAKEADETIVGYGAPAKGNTLLNYCGIGRDFIDYTVDLSPHKQGSFLPGTHIPILAPDEIARTRPDLVFVLPWNLRDEIIDQMGFVREWGGKFVVRAPELQVIS
jgi:2-polyprenyl-3-methyl-5-hydroxy-6-metoxy-1,4-benzoquinol methylase